jgi:tetratricopeptide (TPR) repeat protein
MPRAARRPPDPIAAAAPVGFAPLTAEHIRRYTDPVSFSSGQAFAGDDRLFERTRRGTEIAARWRGSSGETYRTLAILASAEVAVVSDQNPIAVACTCPRGGFCKHAVALLLDWIAAPDAYAERPPVAALLAGKSREELAALIEEMVREAPELEDLLELPPPAAVALSAAPLDEAAVRRQFEDAIDRRGEDDEDDGTSLWAGGWFPNLGPSHDDAKLERLTELGQSCVRAGRWRDALVVFASLVEVVGGDLKLTFADGNALIDGLTAADEGLAAILDAQATAPVEQRLSPSDRARLLETAMALWEADAGVGGYGVGEAVPEAIARNVDAAERAAIEGRLRALVRPPNRDGSGGWLAGGAITFLLVLAGDTGMAPDDLLELSRTAELWNDAAVFLLKLGRLDEAVATAARHLDTADDLLAFADDLTAHKDPTGGDRALDLVEARLWEREGKEPANDAAMLSWLSARYAALGRHEKALDAARRLFKAAPGPEAFAAVKDAHVLVDPNAADWPALRDQLTATLRGKGFWATLAEIHLAEGQTADALAAWRQTERSGFTGNGDPAASGWALFGHGPTLGMRVAAAAERDLPDEAVAIYRAAVERYIAARQRTAYRNAAALLVRLRDTLRNAGRGDEWTTYLTDLRATHKSLRALKEELSAAGIE